MEALLVIDIDHTNGWTPEALREFSGLSNIARVIRKAVEEKRKKGGLVIFIVYPGKDTPEQRGTCPVCDISRGRLSEFLGHRCNDPQEPAFIKNGVDAFGNEEFKKYLRSRGVRDLKIAGCMTDCCVLATVQSAVSNGFNVIVIGKGVFPRLASAMDIFDWTKRATRFALPERPAVVNVV